MDFFETVLKEKKTFRVKLNINPVEILDRSKVGRGEFKIVDECLEFQMIIYHNFHLRVLQRSTGCLYVKSFI